MTSQTPQTLDADGATDGHGSLSSRSFLGLLVTQFLGAVNDNMFRWLVVPICKVILERDYGFTDHQVAAAISAGLICFVVPFLLLAAPAGYLADRFSKRRVIVGCKIGEAALMVLGVTAIWLGSIYVMFAVVFLMGAQSALFGPSKLGSIPEIVRRDRISAANGLIAMTTVLAIVIGSVAGGLLFVLTTPDAAAGQPDIGPGQYLWWVSGLALMGVAGAGLLSSLLIAPLRSANPSRTFPFNAPAQTIRDLRLLASRRPLLRAALGIAVFWCLGAVAQMNVDVLVIYELKVSQTHVGILLGMMATGVGAGSVLAGFWSAGRVELGIVALGAIGIAVSAVMLSMLSIIQQPENEFSATYWWICAWLFLLGGAAGMYNVPILAFLQRHSPAESRGSILAASSFITNLGILAAAVLFWLLRPVMKLSAPDIFLLLGIATVPVVLYVLWLLPGATTRFVVWLLSHTVYRVRIEGRENLPAEGGALVVANHVSFIDGVLMLLYFPRPIRMVARADVSHRWWFRWLAKDLETIFIEPGKRSVVESIRTAREALHSGDSVCIFPEGRITKTGELGEFQPGFMSMLKGTEAPVVPIFLAGLWGSIFSFEGGKVFWKRPRRWPYPVSILIGRPIAEPSDTDHVRRAVAELERRWQGGGDA